MIDIMADKMLSNFWVVDADVEKYRAGLVRERTSHVCVSGRLGAGTFLRG